MSSVVKSVTKTVKKAFGLGSSNDKAKQAQAAQEAAIAARAQETAIKERSRRAIRRGSRRFALAFSETGGLGLRKLLGG